MVMIPKRGVTNHPQMSGRASSSPCPKCHPIACFLNTPPTSLNSFRPNSHRGNEFGQNELCSNEFLSHNPHEVQLRPATPKEPPEALLWPTQPLYVYR